MGPINSTFSRKIQNYHHHGTPELRNAKNEIQSISDLHRSKRIPSNFDEEISLIKEKFKKADYPLRFINSVINKFQKGKDHEDESFKTPLDRFVWNYQTFHIH